MLCIIIIAKILSKDFIPVWTSVPNMFNIFLYIFELSTFPLIAEFNISLMSASAKNSPVYCFEFSIKEFIPKVSFCVAIVLSSAFTVLGINIIAIIIINIIFFCIFTSLFPP